MTDSDPADDSRSARCRFLDVERRRIVAAVVIVALVSLLGLYQEAIFLSRFGINYLEYLGGVDLGLGALNVLAMLTDTRFLSAFVLLVAASMFLLVILYALRIGLATLRHATAMGQPYLPVNDAIRETMAKHRNDRQHSLGEDLRRYLLGPYRLGVVLSVAALLATNISTSAKQDDVGLVASVLRAAPLKNDAASWRQALLSDYRVVSVRTRNPPARLDNLVHLGSSQGYLFYYDAVAQEPVVLAKTDVAGKVVDVTVEEAALASGHAPGTGIDGALSHDIDSATSNITLPAMKAFSSAEEVGGADPTAPEEPFEAHPPALATAPSVSVGTEGTEQPAARDDEIASNGHSIDADTAAAWAADETRRTDAGAKGEEPAEPAYGESELAAIRPTFEQSRDSLERLKERMSALQGQVSEAGSLVGRLDATLSELDELFADLAGEAAVPGGPREHLTGASEETELASYAGCKEVELAQPIRFEADQTSLGFEAIGVLFQARRQLTANPHAADGREWLVLEGHDDTAGSTAQNLVMSKQRAEAVRDFLHAELGVPEEVVKVVALGGTGPEAHFVRIYDCLDRAPTTASATSGVGDLALARTAAASEMGELRLAGNSDAFGNDAADGPVLAAPDLAAGLGAWENERGLLLTVPGDLLWETNSGRVRQAAVPQLASVARVLERYATRRAEIIGHSDASGQRNYNRLLSERRADAVREHLIDRHGIDGDRLRTRGVGEDQPIATNETAEGRQTNRRVEIQIFD